MYQQLFLKFSPVHHQKFSIYFSPKFFFMWFQRHELAFNSFPNPIVLVDKNKTGMLSIKIRPPGVPSWPSKTSTTPSARSLLCNFQCAVHHSNQAGPQLNQNQSSNKFNLFINDRSQCDTKPKILPTPLLLSRHATFLKKPSFWYSNNQEFLFFQFFFLFLCFFFILKSELCLKWDDSIKRSGRSV